MGPRSAPPSRLAQQVVLGGEDVLSDVRTAFREKYLTPPNGRTFSENVVETIKGGLGWS